MAFCTLPLHIWTDSKHWEGLGQPSLLQCSIPPLPKSIASGIETACATDSREKCLLEFSKSITGVNVLHRNSAYFFSLNMCLRFIALFDSKKQQLCHHDHLEKFVRSSVWLGKSSSHRIKTVPWSCSSKEILEFTGCSKKWSQGWASIVVMRTKHCPLRRD